MNILITGDAGSGKTTIAELLAQRGYHAIDIDEGYAHWQHRTKGGSYPSRPASNRQDFEWNWIGDKLNPILEASGDDIAFFCGISSNQADFYSKFEKIILLKTSVETVKKRLKTRTNNPFGKRPGDMELVLKNHSWFQIDMEKRGAVIVDANRPIEEVLSQILAQL